MPDRSPEILARKVAQLLQKYGDAGAVDPSRLRGILQDTGELTSLEANLVWLGSIARVPYHLRQSNLPVPAITRQCVQRLVEEYGLTLDSAEWATMLWKLVIFPNAPGQWTPTDLQMPSALPGTWIGKSIDGPANSDLMLLIDKANLAEFSGRTVEPSNRHQLRSERSLPIMETDVVGEVQANGQLAFRPAVPQPDERTFVGALTRRDGSLVISGRWEGVGRQGEFELRKVGIP